MIINLRSHEKFMVYVPLDTEKGVWGDPLSPASDVAIAGSYGALGDVRVALYKLGGRLVLRMDSTALPLTPAIRAEHAAKDGFALLRISDGDTLLADLHYAQTDDSIEDDLTPFVEDEDSDFGLFIHNIVNTPERQEVLLDVLP